MRSGRCHASLGAPAIPSRQSSVGRLCGPFGTSNAQGSLFFVFNAGVANSAGSLLFKTTLSLYRLTFLRPRYFSRVFYLLAGCHDSSLPPGGRAGEPLSLAATARSLCFPRLPAWVLPAPCPLPGVGCSRSPRCPAWGGRGGIGAPSGRARRCLRAPGFVKRGLASILTNSGFF